MSKKASPAADSRPAEERSAEAATVAWMLSTLATLGGLLLSAGAWALVRQLVKPPAPLAALPGLLLMTAAVAGAATLLLTPLVLRFRNTPPPAAVTTAALLIGAAPWATLLVVSLWPK